ncbi:MAG: tRNA (N(6)-L-threonylcarbamoyladenosine(37)-C(2))-methylthiotransferase MtaB [Anaplasmataceae bacterium]|nr:tRNA (N(6)-L-threonylcarbamoyladenosine(37)-C(2))-methylthiotransferase MtaB [Anaplasmataceae bacterium]
MTNDVITFGCRLNFYETEIIKKCLDKSNKKNTIVINSCAVTNEAERQVRQTIRRVHRENTDKDIIVVGCAVNFNRDEYLSLPGVVKVLTNAEKLNYSSYADNITEDDEIIIDNNKLNNEMVSFIDRSRAFIQIQNGCNHECTFCMITHVRGDNVSTPHEDIIYQIKRLVDNGHNEVVLTGVDITDYGLDLPQPMSLGILVDKILEYNPNLKRLRLSSVDVAEIDDLLFSLLQKHPRLMPYIHMSLQSGNNMILKRMKRRHNREQVIEFYKTISLERNITFGADIIAGFPTETDEMFMDTFNLVKECNIIFTHIFPFSPKSGTPAARMPQVENSIKKDRAKQLRRLKETMIFDYYLSQKDREHNIIIEKNNIGRSEDFSLVHLEESDLIYKERDILKVKIIDANNNHLVGVPLKII